MLLQFGERGRVVQHRRRDEERFRAELVGRRYWRDVCSSGRRLRWWRRGGFVRRFEEERRGGRR